MILGIASFELRYQLRNPVFWVADRHLPAARLRPDRERERQHRHARRGSRERALRDRDRDRGLHHLLSVRGHRLRRQRDRARRQQRLRADRPRDLG